MKIPTLTQDIKKVSKYNKIRKDTVKSCIKTLVKDGA